MHRLAPDLSISEFRSNLSPALFVNCGAQQIGMLDGMLDEMLDRKSVPFLLTEKVLPAPLCAKYEYV